MQLLPDFAKTFSLSGLKIALFIIVQLYKDNWDCYKNISEAFPK